MRCMEIYGNKTSIHAVDAMKNTGVTRKKIRDVHFIFMKLKTNQRASWPGTLGALLAPSRQILKIIVEMKWAPHCTILLISQSTAPTSSSPLHLALLLHPPPQFQHSLCDSSFHSPASGRKLWQISLERSWGKFTVSLLSFVWGNTK